jgi:chlorite dismutase
MGYAVSGMAAKSFLQTYGNRQEENIPKDHTIIFCGRHADNLLITHASTKMNLEHFQLYNKKLQKSFQLKLIAANVSVTGTLIKVTVNFVKPYCCVQF